jgi:hypothetical protein
VKLRKKRKIFRLLNKLLWWEKKADLCDTEGLQWPSCLNIASSPEGWSCVYTQMKIGLISTYNESDSLGSSGSSSIVQSTLCMHAFAMDFLLALRTWKTWQTETSQHEVSAMLKQYIIRYLVFLKNTIDIIIHITMWFKFKIW